MTSLEWEISQRDEKIKELREILNGTIRENGSYSPSKGKWEINYSSILTKLIQEAGRWTERYASDLFLGWRLMKFLVILSRKVLPEFSHSGKLGWMEISSMNIINPIHIITELYGNWKSIW